jgi:MFS family permease
VLLLDLRRLMVTRGVRGLVDGAVSVVLASYLTDLGFSPFEIGVLATGTLLGSAALTLLVGLGGGHLDRRLLLLGTSGLMFATGLCFASVTSFWPLLLIAVVGTLNPSAGDVSVFLPLEQATLADAVPAPERPRAFAWYNVAGGVAGAVGALCAGIPTALAARYGWNPLAAQRSVFLIYAAAAVAIALLYSGLRHRADPPTKRARPLEKSRGVVLRLAALFSVDSFGGGLVLGAMLALWLYKRFDLSVEAAGAFFFAAHLVGALSQFVSSWLAPRLGLVRTMVFTHIPANLLLVAAAFMPTAPLAMLMLLLRASMSQMDVPVRQSLVMAVVPPEERAAAASVTNVPRSLAAAAAPMLAGFLLEKTTFGWPLVAAGLLKAAYDVALYFFGRSLHVEESINIRPLS